MKNILVIGAGQSATSLIHYLLKECESHSWKVTVADTDVELARSKVDNHPHGSCIEFDIMDDTQKIDIIGSSDIVVSMLPADLHSVVAIACIELGKSLLTASYVSDEIRELDSLAKEKGILLLYECGLDPGIDHMSAMKVIDQIRADGNELIGFESFTGGLLAPNNHDNPWDYKFTWNPRNVVMAGQGGVKFLQEKRYKYIPYHRLFRRSEMVHIPGYGYFEGYANRDSLKYIDVYKLRHIATMYRGTLRRPGFCKAWDAFVQIGATDDTYKIEAVGEMTHRQFINSFLSFNPDDSIELKLAHYLHLEMESDIMHKLKWAGIFSEELVGLKEGTPAQILEHILKKKWTLNSEDRDMIVMWHKFNYLENGVEKQINATMVATGEDELHTAMSKTVGYPLGMAAKLILEGKISLTGVQIPMVKAIYDPILHELKEYGFDFIEEHPEVEH